MINMFMFYVGMNYERLCCDSASSAAIKLVEHELV